MPKTSETVNSSSSRFHTADSILMQRVFFGRKIEMTVLKVSHGGTESSEFRVQGSEFRTEYAEVFQSLVCFPFVSFVNSVRSENGMGGMKSFARRHRVHRGFLSLACSSLGVLCELREI